MSPGKPKNIDSYLASVEPGSRAALQLLRTTIHRHLPTAEECISYAIPAFRVAGQIVAGFSARKQGCSYLPFSGSTLSGLAAELTDYEQTKSSLHFSPKQPLNPRLVGRLLDARLAEIAQRARRKQRSKQTPSPR